jgi:hypothetical protein
MRIGNKRCLSSTIDLYPPTSTNCGERSLCAWDTCHSRIGYAGSYTAAIAKSHPELMSHCPHPSEPLNHTLLETYYNYQSSIDNDVDIGGAVAVDVDVDVDISLHNNR